MVHWNLQEQGLNRGVTRCCLAHKTTACGIPLRPSIVGDTSSDSHGNHPTHARVCHRDTEIQWLQPNLAESDPISGIGYRV